MKLELKTENKNYSKSFSNALRSVFFISLVIIFSDISLKLGIISRHYKVDFNCRVLSIEKSKSSFKKLSRLSNLKSKQRIWEFCKDVVQ